jgi:hypothetical protein
MYRQLYRHLGGSGTLRMPSVICTGSATSAEYLRLTVPKVLATMNRS